MTAPIGGRLPLAAGVEGARAERAEAPPQGDRERLLGAARQMEAVFIHHLVSAMRDTVPGGGNPDAPGADVYASLLDEHLAEVVAGDSNTGIAEAMYRQLTAGSTSHTVEAE